MIASLKLLYQNYHQKSRRSFINRILKVQSLIKHCFMLKGQRLRNEKSTWLAREVIKEFTVNESICFNLKETHQLLNSRKTIFMKWMLQKCFNLEFNAKLTNDQIILHQCKSEINLCRKLKLFQSLLKNFQFYHESPFQTTQKRNKTHLKLTLNE